MAFPFLLAMQAGGMVIDYFGTKNQADLIEMGSRVQQAGLEASIEQTRLEAEDASLQAMIKLRKTMGTQLAISAARGTNTGAGSAVLGMQESLRNARADDRMRKLNLLNRETEAKGKGLIASLNASGEVSKLWQGFAGRTINTFSSRGF